MQTSAVPDLAHTHARPVHWLATATAMAGVVAAAGLLQPTAQAAPRQARRTPERPLHPPPRPIRRECGSLWSAAARRAW